MRVFIDGKEYIAEDSIETEITKRLGEREVSAKRSILYALRHAKIIFKENKELGLTVNAIEAEGAYRALLGLAIDLNIVDEYGEIRRTPMGIETTFITKQLNECLAKSLKSLTYYGCLNLAINTIAVTSYG